MDLSFFLCAVVIASLPSDRSPYGEPTSCDCPEIPPWNRTKPPPRKCGVIGDTFRYTCVVGYRRKAGTSNLIKCLQEDGVAKWRRPNLDCIYIPNLPPAQPATPKRPAPTALGDDHSFHTMATAGMTSGGRPTLTRQPVPSNQTDENQSEANQGNGEQLSAVHVTATTVVLCILFVGALIGLAVFCQKRRVRRDWPQAASAKDDDVSLKLNATV